MNVRKDTSYPWKISTSARTRGKGYSARQCLFPFPSPVLPSPSPVLPSRFLDFLPVWPRLNYRKPCFGCHGRIPISRRVARVAGTPYGVSRILYEFLSWNDSFICLSSIPSPPPPPPAPLPSPARVHLASSPPPSASASAAATAAASLATGTAESLSIPICLSFHLTESQTWRSFCRGPDGWISRASKPATELGARTKYTPSIVRLEYIYKLRSFSHCSKDMTTENSSPCIREFFRNCFEG